MWQHMGKHPVRKWSMGLKEMSWVSVAEGTRVLFNLLFPKWRSVQLWPNTIVIWKIWDCLLSLVSQPELERMGSSYHSWCQLDPLVLEHGNGPADPRLKMSDGHVALLCTPCVVSVVWPLGKAKVCCVPLCMWSVWTHSNIVNARQACPVLVVPLLFFQSLQQVFCMI